MHSHNLPKPLQLPEQKLVTKAKAFNSLYSGIVLVL